MFPALISLIVGILATFRLTRLIRLDDGPGNALLQWRIKINPDGFWGKWIACPFCVSVWVALPVAVLMMLNWLPSNLFLLWWALAGASEIMELSLGVKR